MKALVGASARSGNGSGRPACGGVGGGSLVGALRELDLPAAQAHRAGAHDDLPVGAELGLGDLEAAARLRRAAR